MIFHSLDFVVFFLVTTLVYWRLPHRAQNLLLLGASYFFYGYVHPWFLTLVFVSTVADYWAAIGMERSPERKKLYLGLSLLVNLGMLGFFKYFNFFVDNVHTLLAAVHLDLPLPALRVILPVGISFYTFQELSYTLEVYRGRLKARTDFLDFATFVCFFPQLVAGPIERASHLLPQVERPRTFDWGLARTAALLIVWGYFKKLVIADNAGVIANKVFALDAPSFPVLWAGVFAFGIQIYADFSAYSDIARGTARWLGFEIMRNFDHPYLATGPVDFWRRWHISLSSWFRDYVYIPLGGSQSGRTKMYRNILITFLVSGLWHGASWNYVVWGAYHGVLLVLARVVPLRAPAGGISRGVVVAAQTVAMFALVNIGWLMFRETDTAFLLRDFALSPFAAAAADWQIGGYLFLVALTYSLPLWLHGVWALYLRPWLEARSEIRQSMSWAIGQAVLAGVAFALMLALRSRQSLDFIYFQF